MQETIASIEQSLDDAETGRRMYALIERLYPICRSITGEGFRKSQRIIQEQIPALKIQSVPSGTQCFDWTVPKEWNIRDAYILGPNGTKVVDFQRHNLHVVNYSCPIRRRMRLDELKQHLHTLPDQPTLIPYRTSYYQETWGFCLAHEDYLKLPEGEYEVVIDSTLADGVMNYGEIYLPGATSDEVLLTCHACHPSLCNDNLSGNAIAAMLAELIAKADTRYSFRILYLPGGIGSVVWMSQNQQRLSRIKHGLVLSCLGDSGSFTYKRTRGGDAEIDRVAAHVLAASGQPHAINDFSPYGYDERNFNSPKYKLLVGSLTRSTHEQFAGYHSSGDNLALVTPAALAGSLRMYLRVLGVLEANRKYRNLIPNAEPQLGKRGLYGMMGGLPQRRDLEMALLWVMNFSDGEHSLLDIANRSGYGFDLVRQAADLLCEHGLLAVIDEAEATSE